MGDINFLQENADMSYHFTVLFEREPDGGYHSSCPALPGCHSQGDTLDQTVANMHEAMKLYLESLRAHHEPIPTEDLFIRAFEIAVPA